MSGRESRRLAARFRGQGEEGRGEEGWRGRKKKKKKKKGQVEGVRSRRRRLWREGSTKGKNEINDKRGTPG